MHIKVDDIVEVITGEDSGEQGKVLRVLRDQGKVIVEGMNQVYKHVKPSQKNPQGGRLSKEMPLQLSNVKLVCPSCGVPSRTGAKYLEDGSKVRFCKKCQSNIGVLAPARARYAKK